MSPGGGRRRISLVGFMGAGKSTVARLVGSRLDWRAIDTDAEVEALAGRSIPAIFADSGEAAFRRLEVEVVARALVEDGVVIALGGGAFEDPDSRRRLLRDSAVMYLRASRATLSERIAPAAGARPLVANGFPDDLLARRVVTYRMAHETVDTDGRSPEAVAAEVVTRWRARGASADT